MSELPNMAQQTPLVTTEAMHTCESDLQYTARVCEHLDASFEQGGLDYREFWTRLYLQAAGFTPLQCAIVIKAKRLFVER
jgi:hypothetical protein